MLRQLIVRLLAGAFAATLVLTGYSQAATVTPGQVTLTVSEQVAAPAASAVFVQAATIKRAKKTKTQIRHSAMRWAKTKRGGWYRYGGNGPSSYDCSGLVSAAYRVGGKSIQRTVKDIRYGGKFKQVSASQVRWGDLVIYGTSHMELYSHKKNGVRWMFGAHRTGTKIGYKRVYYSKTPTFWTLR